MSAPIYVVSGLPRSGTSMMMRMLEAGGLELVVDDHRPPTEDNPRGFYEFEPAKRLRDDNSWLPGAEGKGIKLISELLTALPEGPRYRVVFMRRQLDEVLASQLKMLERRHTISEQDGADDDAAEMKRMFILHLAEIEALMRDRPDVEVLYVSYNRMLASPERQTQRVHRFLSGDGLTLDLGRMMQVVDPELYRQRKAEVD